MLVLILVVVDDTFRDIDSNRKKWRILVLILVVVDDTFRVLFFQ